MGECDKNLRRQRETVVKRMQHKVERKFICSSQVEKLKYLQTEVVEMVEKIWMT